MNEIGSLVIPRFDLVAACAGDRSLLRRPSVLAAQAKGGSVVQEVSAPAEAEGVERGMRLGRALALCPSLRVATPDPIGGEELWERVLAALEGIGAEVESKRSGEAFFEVHPLRQLYGGKAGEVIATARRAVPLSVRAAVAPARFASFAAAVVPRQSSQFLGGAQERVVQAANLLQFLAPLDVVSLAVGPGLPDREAQCLVASFEDLGIQTLGTLASLSADHVADRFGELGLLARRLARGEDTRLQPRTTHEEIAGEIELHDGAAGVQLERGLELLVERVLASPERKDRTILAARLVARFAEGGSWSAEQTLGAPTALAEVLSSLLLRRLADLPRAPSHLSLRLTAFGPRAGDQLKLPDMSQKQGGDRLAEALGQLGVVNGPESMLDIVDLDQASRVPERRVFLMPHSPDRRRRN